MNKRHYEHTLPNIRGSLSNTYVANATKISLLMVLLLLMVDELFSCSCTEAVTYISASANHYPGGPSRIRFNGEAGIRITGE